MARILFITRNLENAEPIGLLILGAVLKAHGHEVRLIGSRNTPLGPVMNTFAPHIVGYSVCTGLHRYLLDLNRGLKKRWPFLSIFGGPHPTLFPDMIDEPGVDLICRGEGEGALLDLATAIDAADQAGIEHIQNLWVKTVSGITRNPLRPLINDLDELPFPDRALRYDADPESRTYPVKSFLVSRGCPFNCSYCFNAGFAELYGNGWFHPRVRSVDNVLTEIEEVKGSTPLDFVQFRESLFPWQEDWLEDFAQAYSKRIKLPFFCHVRADLVTPRRARLLARAGCFSVNMGIECGDEAYRKAHLNRPMTNDDIVAASDLLHTHGIRILSDNMLGLPGAPDDADRQTLELNRRCGIEYPLAMIFQPYPGTGLGNYARRFGLFDGEIENIEANYYLRTVLKHPSAADNRRIDNFQKFFAVLVEAPWLEKMVIPLLSLAPNLIFHSVFRAWYMYCYTFRIVPHSLTLTEGIELMRTLLGLYTPEVNLEFVDKNQ